MPRRTLISRLSRKVIRRVCMEKLYLKILYYKFWQNNWKNRNSVLSYLYIVTLSMAPPSSASEKYAALQPFLLECLRAQVINGDSNSFRENMTALQTASYRKRVASLLEQLPDRFSQFSDQEIVQIFHAVCRQWNVSISGEYPQLFARLLEKLGRKPHIIIECDGNEFTSPKTPTSLSYLEKILDGIDLKMSQGEIPTPIEWRTFFIAAYYLSREDRSSEIFQKVYHYLHHLRDCSLITWQGEGAERFMHTLYNTKITRNVNTFAKQVGDYFLYNAPIPWETVSGYESWWTLQRVYLRHIYQDNQRGVGCIMIFEHTWDRSSPVKPWEIVWITKTVADNLNLDLDRWEYAVYQEFTLDGTENMWLDMAQPKNILTAWDVQGMLSHFHRSVSFWEGERVKWYRRKKWL